MLVRITGSGFAKQGSITNGHPVDFRHWQEVVREADDMIESAANDESEEAVVELWLEDPMSFQAAFNEEAGIIRTGGMMQRVTQRADGRKLATATTGWDQDFADAQKHAASVLSKLGNAR